ncbi:MAG: hypothetical protein GC136_01440 [Alphaproteobacteria bacterium]|nr:hypothetical protein [Alphaproteobacteria bacterium]
MRTRNTHRHVRALLEETDNAYQILIDAGENPNIDFAGYACQTYFARLKRALGHADITFHQLEGVLRRVMQEHHAVRAEGHGWADFMASVITAEIANVSVSEPV